MTDDRSKTAPEPDAHRNEDDDEPKLTAGDHVGRYELLGMLGAGGMSFVYLAHDPELDRKVALKLMRAKMVGPDGARRLQREAQALARLSHPNVVPVYDVGLADGQAYVAMEYVEGKTLRLWLRDARTWREVLDAMLDAGRGLAAAHAAGLVHRDFKPDNVLIGKDGRVRVLDFGLARLASVLDGTASMPSLPSPESPPSSSGSRPSLSSPAALITRADQLIGTPAYMAPEQLRRDHTDERADQFSFCVTLYEALFGERPFELPKGGVGSSVATVTVDVKHASLKTPKPPPRASKVPRWIQKVVARGLAHEASARYPTMDALLAALQADPWRPWRRAAAGASLVALLGVAALGVARAQSGGRPTCRGGESRAAAVWGAGTRDEVRAAFAKTGLAYADEAATAVAKSLDGYMKEWAAASDDACAATRLRGEQSEEVLDLRQACLDTRLREVSALVLLLKHPDDGTVQQASRAAKVLGPLDQCADVAELRSPVPRPRDAETAAKVLALEDRLAQVEATYAVGRASEAATDGDALLEDAKKVGFGPMVARTEFWRGRANADLGDSEKSIPAFRGAFAAALASREDRVLRESAARLAQEYIYAAKAEEFRYWADVAQAAIDRGAPDPALQSFVDHTRCVAIWQEGKIFERLDCLESHAAKVERTRPLDEWELVTLGLAASDAGQLERGVSWVRRGVEYSLRLNGPLHPRTIEMRGYLVKALLDEGDLDAAMEEGRAAIAQAEEGAVHNEYLVGKIHLYLGITLRESGKLDEACVELRHARGALSDESEVEGEVAQVDVDAGHPELALEYLRKTLADTEKDLAPEHPNVILSQLELGRALLARGDVAEARAVLDAAHALGAHAEIAPSMAADLDFTDARALYAMAPEERPRAMEMAKRARDVYAKITPHRRHWDEAVAEVDAWIARPELPKPRPAAPGAKPAASRCSE